jgi:thiosulfate reductase cytochrome b subunit
MPQVDLFEPPEFIRLGGWLGGALQWHLPFAWLFLGTGAAYLLYELATGNYRQVLVSRSDWRGIWPMVCHYFFFGPKPAQRQIYNPLQKLAYTIAIAFGAVLAVTGLGLYKPVQLSWLVSASGGLRMLRFWHFAAMTALLAFFPGHLVMVAVHGWRNCASMWTGGT